MFLKHGLVDVSETWIGWCFRNMDWILTLTISPLGSVSECSSPRLIVFSVVLIPHVLLKLRVPAEPSVIFTTGWALTAECLLNHPRSEKMKKNIKECSNNQKLKFILAIALKICISDSMFVKPKCVWVLSVFFSIFNLFTIFQKKFDCSQTPL